MSFPSYLPFFIPKVLGVLRERDLAVTAFVVGQDAALDVNREPLRALAEAGHEIGNHSFHHEPWLHLYTEEQLDAELVRAEEAILEATGARPRGFRGPGFSLSRSTLEVLARRGYVYDATTLPSLLGPLARAYYLRAARLSPEERRKRELLFGSFRDGLRPIRPYRWKLSSGSLIEIPVTTLPLLRTPIHMSYVLYLATYSPALARQYFRVAINLCRWTGVEPSILLHPLDFLGGEEVEELAFFPAMNRSGKWKLERLGEALDILCRRYRVVTLAKKAEELERKGSLPLREPRFAHDGVGRARPAASRPIKP